LGLSGLEKEEGEPDCRTQVLKRKRPESVGRRENRKVRPAGLQKKKRCIEKKRELFDIPREKNRKRKNNNTYEEEKRERKREGTSFVSSTLANCLKEQAAEGKLA